MLSARTLFVALILATAVASAQTPPHPTNGGRPFGSHPGTGNSGPFTPGAEGSPSGPYTPGTIDAPTGGGPFTRPVGKVGFWGKVKSIGASIWGGIATVGHFIWTLGGFAPWAHMPAVGTLPTGGVGTNVDRNENTTPPNHPSRPRPDLTSGGPGVASNPATSGAGMNRDSIRFLNP